MARVTPHGGTPFECDVAELRPNSILLLSSTVLPFRSEATVEVGGVTVDAEVVFAQDGKLAMTFPTVPEIFEAIEVLDNEPTSPVVVDDHDEVLSAIDDALASYTTSELHVSDLGILDLPTPEPDAELPQLPKLVDGRLVPEHTTDVAAWCVMLLSERPLVARTDGAPIAPARLEAQGKAVLLQPTPLAEDLVALVALDRKAVQDMLTTSQTALETLLGPADEIDDSGPPDFGSDGRTVTFVSTAQYEREHKANLSNNALVVRSGPLPIGQRHVVDIIVPGQANQRMAAVVTFVGDGILGFTIQPVGASDASAPARDEVTVAAKKEHTWRRATDVGALLAPGDVGCYFGVLTTVLEQRGRSYVALEGDGEKVELWIDEGRVVFTTRFPEALDDQIGQRLLTDRTVTPSIIKQAIEQNAKRGPLGGRLIESGRIQRADLHRHLRLQMIDRTIIPMRWSRGTARVGPWNEPAIEGRLLPVSGGSIRAEMIRAAVAQVPHDQLNGLLAPHLTRMFTVHANRIESAFRLRKKEERAVTRFANESSSVDAFLRSGGLRPTEAVTLITLGVGLGFIELGMITGDVTPTGPVGRNDELAQKVERLEKANHFDVLELHWSASHQEILEAYQHIKQTLEVSPKDPEARRLLAALRGRVTSAFEVIGNRVSRVKYRNTLCDEAERRRAAKHLIEQAELKAIRDDQNDVERLLDAAEELVPGQPLGRLRDRLRDLQA